MWRLWKRLVDERHMVRIIRCVRRDEAGAFGYSQRKRFKASKQWLFKDPNIIH